MDFLLLVVNLDDFLSGLVPTRPDHTFDLQ